MPIHLSFEQKVILKERTLGKCLKNKFSMAFSEVRNIKVSVTKTHINNILLYNY